MFATLERKKESEILIEKFMAGEREKTFKA
jgi:hypothetical protein